MIYFVIGFIGGAILDSLISLVKNRRQIVVGSLDIDKNDPGLIRFKLEPKTDIRNCKYVRLKVNSDIYISQE